MADFHLELARCQVRAFRSGAHGPGFDAGGWLWLCEAAEAGVRDRPLGEI